MFKFKQRPVSTSLIEAREPFLFRDPDLIPSLKKEKNRRQLTPKQSTDHDSGSEDHSSFHHPNEAMSTLSQLQHGANKSNGEEFTYEEFVE